MLRDPDRQVMEKAYARWAPVYDDAFVFPSLTDTFRLVLLEALASGVPVAAFPAAAPRDVIGEAPVGRLDGDLQRACLEALECSREECRAFAWRMTWEASARIFLTHVAEANNQVVRMRRLWLRRRRPVEESSLTGQKRVRASSR